MHCICEPLSQSVTSKRCIHRYLPFFGFWFPFQAAGFTTDELEEALMILRERRSKISRDGEVDLGFLEKVETSKSQGNFL